MQALEAVRVARIAQELPYSVQAVSEFQRAFPQFTEEQHIAIMQCAAAHDVNPVSLGRALLRPVNHLADLRVLHARGNDPVDHARLIDRINDFAHTLASSGKPLPGQGKGRSKFESMMNAACFGGK